MDRALALVFTVVIGFAPVARAQCAAGRVVNEATAGRCCWPGQRWDAEAARCEGPPRCPAGHVAEGERCVASRSTSSFVETPPAGYAPASSGLSSPPPSMGPGSWSRGPSPQSARRTVTSPIEELVMAGGVTAIIGYGFHVVVGALAVAYGTVNGWMPLIPLAGGFIWAGAEASGGASAGQAIEMIMGITGSAVQSVGLILMIVGGLAQETSVVGPRGGSSLAPEVVPGPGDAGLAVRWRL